MKILHVCPRYPFMGGVERVVKNVAEHLVKQHQQVTVYATAPSKQPSQPSIINGVTVQKYCALAPHGAYHIPQPKMLMHLLREQRDIIHAHSIHDITTLMAHMANMLSMNSKFVVSPYYHGQGHSRLAQILWTPYRPVMRRVLKDADAIIVNSQAAQNTVHTTFAPSCRIFVVYDGVDVQQIQNAKPFQLSENRKVLLYVGRLERYKNVHTTIAAMTDLPENFHFYIIGQGPDKPSLIKQVQSLGLQHRVHFLSYQPDEVVYRWLKTAHVFMHLSSVESFGMTCIESLAAGTPVIANDDEFGLRETAALYPEHIMVYRVGDQSTMALAKLIAQVADVKPITVDVSQFAWHRIAEAVGSIYTQVVGN